MPIQKPALSVLTGGKDLHVVTREEHELVVPFLGFNAPFTDSDDSNVEFNIYGKTRVIILQGFHDGTGQDGADTNEKIGDFIFEIEEWVNSGTQTSRTYTDSFNVSYNVHCHSFSWARSISVPGRILYTFLLREVSSLI